MTVTRVDSSELAAHRDAIDALDAAARAADGHDALGESVWRDLDRPGPDSVGFLLDGRGYLHVQRSGRQWTAGVVRVPDASDTATATALLNPAVAHVAAHGGGRLECWVFGATDADDTAFGEAGFGLARELYEMRVPLPRPDVAPLPSGVTVRAFEPGRDDAAWLAVNNLAFAGHPDQGDWSEADLQARMAEPWFDPSLFLLAVDAAGVAGFNWLKLHEPVAPDPRLGEIYVIGVDPRAQGTGLGRSIAVAGLAAVYARGAPVGMLFCAADNTGALALYRSLGFEVHRTDRAYARDVA